MKTRIFLILGSLFFLYSCNKLNTAPTNAVTDQLIFKDVNTLSTLFEGTWAKMLDSYYGGTFGNPGFKTIGLASDAMGNDAALITTKYGFRDAYPFTEMNDKTKSRVSAIWSNLYSIINNANIILKNVDNVSGSDADKRALKGQALGLRANTYLTIATFYQFSYLKDSLAKTAPIYTTPATDTTQGKPRASLKEIYSLIFSDLTTAKTLLQGYVRPAKYRFDINVVNGLLARASLNTGRWADASTYAEAAQQNYPLMAAADYSKGFNDVNNSEWIWGQPQTTNQSTASYSFHFLDVSSAGSYYYSYMADPFFKNLFDDGDVRKTLFEWDTVPGRLGYLEYKKFKFRSDLTGDQVLMRSAEQYLIQAEAEARQGNTQKSLTVLNKLKLARSAKLSTTSDQAQLISEILIERRKELWGEGFALADIIRNQQAVVRKAYVDASGSPIKVTVTRADGSTIVLTTQSHTALKFPDGSAFVPNSPYYLFAIPLNEEQNNPNLYN